MLGLVVRMMMMMMMMIMVIVMTVLVVMILMDFYIYIVGQVRMMMCRDLYIWQKENLEDSGGWSAKRPADVNMQGLVHLRIGVIKAKLLLTTGMTAFYVASHVF